MITKKTIELYCNPPIRLKGQYTVICKTFEKLDCSQYELVTDSQDIEFWLEYIGFPKKDRKDVTACMVYTHDGELIDIWLSESSRYYDLYDGLYHSLLYYVD